MDNNHCGFVVKVSALRPHSNADRLQIATFFGNDTCVSLDTHIGDIGIYFPSDLCLSPTFCDVNHLCRKNSKGEDDTGYLDPDKRNIRAIRLRGEKSDGIYLPIETLASFGDISSLTPGDTIGTFNGHVIAEKYIPKVKYQPSKTSRSHGKASKMHRISCPFFVEHIDTPQLRFNMDKYHPGDIICLTEKIHGSSTRHGYFAVEQPRSPLRRLFGIPAKVKNEYFLGTRRTVVETLTGGYYGDNGWRINWGKRFEGKLMVGEEAFGEIAGFYAPNQPIMAVADNLKTKDKEFIKQYGKTTTFSYGCSSTGEGKPLNRLFIYRMTYTSPTGYVIEYPWDLVRLRAEQMGFEIVPELERFIYTTEEDFLAHIQKWEDIPSTIDPSHIIEGVVIRRLNSPQFDVAKDKSFSFKVIENICKVDAEMPDMEEIEDVLGQT